jgi:hypothetical protein
MFDHYASDLKAFFQPRCQHFVHLSFKLHLYYVNPFSARTLRGNVFVPRFSTRITSPTNQVTKFMEQSLLEKLTDTQLVKKFPAFDGT